MLPRQPGTYALLLASTGERTVRVGTLGDLRVVPGYYVYVGSAHGPGGLAARVSRHRAAAKKLRWHVDYLRAVTDWVTVWYTVDPQRWECGWADVMSRMPRGALPMVGFGASDCGCRSHLFYFRQPPSYRTFCRRVKDALPGAAPIHQPLPGAPILPSLRDG